MGETEDPRASLGARDVKSRAAATRDLAREGTWEDVEVLVGVAMRDKSTSVRLYAAAAAADIAARHRGAAGQVPLDPDQIAQVRAWVGAGDPGSNPGLLLLLAAVPVDATLAQLGRLLRDPRNGVRRGALAAVRRLALSGASVGDARLPRAVEQWMALPRATPEVILDLILLVGEAGWEECRQAVIVGSSAGRPHGEAAATALARLDQRREEGALDGLWVSDGLDVMEVGPPRGRGWLLVHAGQAWSSEAEGPEAWPPVDRPVRLVWAPVLAQTAEIRRLAVQQRGGTWWRCAGKDVVRAIDDLVEDLPPAREALVQLAADLEAVDGALAVRARALLLWRAGEEEVPLELLRGLAAHKRPRADVFWWLGRILADQGRGADATAALEDFLERAGKRATWRVEAAALLDELRG